MIRYYKTPSIVRWIYPSLVWRKDNSSTIYLTFDDGPHPEVTPWVMAELDKVGAKATFFCVGKHMQENQQLLLKMHTEGHLIANHTFEHLNGRKVRDQSYLDSIERCDQVLRSLNMTSTYFRPPYGKIKRSQMNVLRHKDIIMWSHLAYDFDEGLNVASSLRMLQKAAAGSILVFHDSRKAFKNLEQLLPKVLSHYKERGFRMQTLDHD